MGDTTKPKEFMFYEPVKVWLEQEGYQARVVGGTRSISLPTGPRLGVSSIEPDVIGYKKEDYSELLALVEVKIDPMGLLDGIGRCEVFKVVADFVYLALHEDNIANKIGANSLYERMEVGVLSVSLGDVKVKTPAKRLYNQDHYLREVMLAMVKSALGIAG